MTHRIDACAAHAAGVAQGLGIRQPRATASLQASREGELGNYIHRQGRGVLGLGRATVANRCGQGQAAT